jgi:hypothetical protein
VKGHLKSFTSIRPMIRARSRHADQLARLMTSCCGGNDASRGSTHQAGPKWQKAPGAGWVRTARSPIERCHDGGDLATVGGRVTVPVPGRQFCQPIRSRDTVCRPKKPHSAHLGVITARRRRAIGRVCALLVPHRDTPPPRARQMSVGCAGHRLRPADVAHTRPRC